MSIDTCIISLTFRRKVNTGNFESFDLEATANCGARDAGKTMIALQAFVDEHCNNRSEHIRRARLRREQPDEELPI